ANQSPSGVPEDADDDTALNQQGEVGSPVENGRFGRSRGQRPRHRGALEQGRNEGMATMWQAMDVDLGERPRHQGGLGAPGGDHAVAVTRLVRSPDRYDGEARRDQ